MPNERQKSWEQEQQIIKLTQQLSAAEIDNNRLTKERDAAIRARFEDQETATSLRHQLAAKTDEADSYQDLLEEAREKMYQDSDDDGLSPEIQLSQAKEDVARLKARGESDAALITELGDTNRTLRQQLQQSGDVVEENSKLRGQLRFWESRAKLYASQLGNFYVGGGRIPFTTFVLETMREFPVIGPVISRASQNLHSRYQDKRNNH